MLVAIGMLASVTVGMTIPEIMAQENQPEKKSLGQLISKVLEY